MFSLAVLLLPDTPLADARKSSPRLKALVLTRMMSRTEAAGGAERDPTTERWSDLVSRHHGQIDPISPSSDKSDLKLLQIIRRTSADDLLQTLAR